MATYAELVHSSNRLAHLLQAAGCTRGDRVCVLLHRSIDAVVAMLAILKAGCSYVPIDPTAPALRTRHIIATVQPVAMVIGASALPQVQELRRLNAIGACVALVTLEDLEDPAPLGGGHFGPSEIEQQESTDPAAAGCGDETAYIMFTSGSTGEPKGPVISHLNVRSFIDWAVSHFDIHPGDRHSWQPPLHFDLSTLDVYAGLAAGAEVHIVPPGTMLPRQLTDFITEHRLIQWFSVPSAMAYAGRTRGGRGQLRELRRVLWCGEVMPTAVLRDWMTRAPNARFTNLYGPTETTVASSYFTVPAIPEPDDPPAPIGHACDGEEILVLDEALNTAAVGQIGEIYITGNGVCGGYWNDEAQTRAAFVADLRPGKDGARMYRTGDLGRCDSDGLTSFVGRRDTQIKSRGYRIELGEIEAALARLPEVEESAVIALELDGFEGTAIGCALSLTSGTDLDLTIVRRRLGEQLPKYMIPTRWRVFEDLPKNANGKIDRRRLTLEMTESR
jgi:amino acid adenylation domain-containing protein